MRKYTGFLVGSMLFFLGCSNDRLTITKEYIKNDSWDNKNCNISIKKLLLTDNTFNINNNDFKKEKIPLNVKVDSSFIFTSNGFFIKDSISRETFTHGCLFPSKLYFNRPNSVPWNKISKNSSKKVEKIGLLKRDSWYLFSDILSSPTEAYVYIDNSSKSHIYYIGGHTNY